MISNKEEDNGVNNDPRWLGNKANVDITFESPDLLTTQNPKAVGSSKGGKKVTKVPTSAKKYKKAPDAPRRFKSAFIFFSIEKHREIRESLQIDGQKEKTTNVAKMVSEAWKGLSEDKRQIWEEKARKDRARYEVEVASYKGPWKIPAQRAKKPSDAPKRPMSAFLSFSNKRRIEAMRSNPDLSQAEISALLSKMWNEADKEIRDEYVLEELKQRDQYKKDIAIWREKDKGEKTKQRNEREARALKMAETGEKNPFQSEEPFLLDAPTRTTSLEGAQNLAIDLLSSDEFSLNRVMGQQQTQSSLSYAQNVARIARQQETLQQLSNVYMRQQETLQNLMYANMAANLGGRQQQSNSQPLSLGNNLGLQNQMTNLSSSLDTINLQQQLHHLAMANSMSDPTLHQGFFHQGDYNQYHGEPGIDDWTEFPIGE